MNNLELAVAFPAAVLVCIFLYFMYYRRVSLPLSGTTEWITRIVNKPRFTFMMTRYPMERRDILPLAVITVVFSFLAFYKLGDFSAPQSFLTFSQTKSQITVELENAAEIGSLRYYTGLYTGHYTLEFSPDGVNWQEQYAEGDNEYAMNQGTSHLFKWREADINSDNLPTKFIRLSASKTPMELGELAVYDTEGNIISAITAFGAPELFDEQELIPSRATYMNSMYFDEIYHGRTALEHIKNIYPYETTHPPLGKEIITIGIRLFGMTPFGWRFMGALFGVAMLVILYIFLKNMFGKTPVAVCGTLLLGFEFMRFVQTRIATIDTYAVIFILLSYFFMFRFITKNPEAKFHKRIAALALSGLFFGIGCAAKWVVVYAGLGLIAFYVLHLVMLGRYYKENDMPGYSKLLLKILLSSVLFFGIIPAAVYCLSYIPYGTAKGMSISGGMLLNGDFYKIIWENQKSMLRYHGLLEDTHSYSSRWFQWILDARPILYYREYIGNYKSAFAAFGNPIIWWGGFLAVAAMAVRVVKYREGAALFILIAYLSQILPWLFIQRVVFIYHYFPSALFLIFALSHVFNTLLDRRQGRYKQAVYGFTASAGVLFVMFYPALSGMPAPQWYFRYFLKWMPGAWPF